MEKKKQLLFSVTAKDFVVEYYNGEGKGGQNRIEPYPRLKTGDIPILLCRIHHPASNSMAYCQEERSQKANRERAFKRLTELPTFQKYLKIETAKAAGKYIDIDQKVEQAMAPNNIRVDIHDESGRWINEKERPDLVS